MAFEGEMKTAVEFQRMYNNESVQSPINISFNKASEIILPRLLWENMRIKPSKMQLTNTGYTVILAGIWKKQKPMVSGGPLTAKYRFWQLHFHWGKNNKEGSVHTYDTEAFPLEMHAVFLKECYATQEEALKHNDGMIVVVYIYRLSDRTNETIELVSKFFSHIQTPETSVYCPSIGIRTLLNPFSQDYFLYRGSLEVNGSRPEMLWLHCRHPFPITSAQMQSFRNLVSHGLKSINLKNQEELSNKNGERIFLVSPSSKLESALYQVDQRKQLLNDLKIGATSAAVVSSSRRNGKNKTRSVISEDSSELSRCNHQSSTQRLLINAMSALRNAMKKLSYEKVSKKCSKSSEEFSESSKPIDNDKSSCDLSQSASESMFTPNARHKKSVSTSREESVERPNQDANSSISETEFGGLQVKVPVESRSGELRSSLNCSRSKTQFAGYLGDEPSAGISTDPCSKTIDELKPDVHVVQSQPTTGLSVLSIKDSVQGFRAKYRSKELNIDVVQGDRNRETSFSELISQKTTDKTGLSSPRNKTLSCKAINSRERTLNEEQLNTKQKRHTRSSIIPTKKNRKGLSINWRKNVTVYDSKMRQRSLTSPMPFNNKKMLQVTPNHEKNVTVFDSKLRQRSLTSPMPFTNRKMLQVTPNHSPHRTYENLRFDQQNDGSIKSNTHTNEISLGDRKIKKNDKPIWKY